MGNLSNTTLEKLFLKPFQKAIGDLRESGFIEEDINPKEFRVYYTGKPIIGVTLKRYQRLHEKIRLAGKQYPHGESEAVIRLDYQNIETDDTASLKTPEGYNLGEAIW